MTLHCSLALVSLPGARLSQLAQMIAPDVGLPVASGSGLETWSPRCTPAIFVLPSDVLETGSPTLVEDFRQAGNPVFFLDLPWEQSWQSVNPEKLSDPNGLPWRATYRRLAKDRREVLMAYSDYTVPTEGTLTELAQRLLKVIAENGCS